MKPRNKSEKKIVLMSKRLKPIPEWKKEWAKNAIPHTGLTCSGNVWCTSCGALFPLKEGNTATCPICGRKLKLEKSQKRKFSETYYFHVLETLDGMQVVRTFVIIQQAKKYESTYYCFSEVIRRFINEKGVSKIFARSCNSFSVYYDCWLYNTPLTLKGGENIRYTPNSPYVCPRYKVLPILKRNGFTLRGLCGYVGNTIKGLLTNPECEFLIKSRQYALFHYCNSYPSMVKRFHHSICICNRNGYIVKDAPMYFDYLEMLDYFHLDTHNAHYVCPKSLKKAHDTLLKRKTQAEQKEYERRKALEARTWEEKYHKEKEKFLGITFGNSNIRISVIQSVKEMRDEGEAMHHCVFQCEYYKKVDSLILSAKDPSGNRIETIEVDLKNFSIVQSRAVCNKVSAQHDEILNLVNNNMNKIRGVCQ